MIQGAENFVGRDTELELLERLLDESCAGESRFVVASGEAGIGKTSLLGELRRRAEDRDCLVLEGRASELERELPFGLVVDALDAYLESLDARAYSRLAADGLEELAAVFPALRSLGEGAVQPANASERFRAHHAVRELLERLAVRQPLVLVLDDLHWSDGASLELIAHLLRRPAQAAVFLVVAFRTGQVEPTFAAAIESAAREGQIEQLPIGPLDRADAQLLVDADAPAEQERLYRESGGNPFYLLQLARTSGAPRAGGVATAPGADEAEGVPAAVIAAIANELDGLAASVRAFAEAAAVAGDPFELDIAVAAADVPEPEALMALDELIARDFVRPGEVPRRFEFRHPLVRRAVYETCTPGVRLLAHERSADALAERGVPATARAHHVEQSARHGDTAAVAVLREAGRATSERAPSSAARWFEAAVRLLPQEAPPEERTELLLALAGACGSTGRLEDSRAALLEALELAAEVDIEGRVHLIAACAGVEQLLGLRAHSHARLRAGLQEVTEEHSPAGAVLRLSLAVDCFYGDEFGLMFDWAEAALETAKELGDDPMVGAAAAIAAFAGTLTPAMVAAARELCEEAAEVVDDLSDADLAKQLSAAAWLCSTEFYLDRYEDGLRHAERGLAVARATGQGEFFPMLAQAEANLLFVSGRPSEAAELLDGVVDGARLSDSPVALAWSLANRSTAAIFAGEQEEAVSAGAEGVALTESLDDGPVKTWSGATYAYALLQAGDAEAALAIAARRCGGDEVPKIPGAWRGNYLAVMARCHLALGQTEDARRTCERGREVAKAFGLPYAIAAVQSVSAELALDAGDAAAALDEALAAAAGCEEIGARIEAALARATAGRALIKLGDEERAADELERAAAALEACGAPRRRQSIERDLRKLGRGVHRRSQPGKSDAKGLASLTGRELEVARLVVDRRTNPEIAEDLFLSIKTVETHMRNIFRKLDVGSRVEVARILEREDELAPPAGA